MEFVKSFAQIVRDTILDPRAAAGRALGLDLPRAVLWQVLVLVVILGMLQTFAYDALLPSPAENALMPFFGNQPLLTAGIAFAATLAMVVAMHRVGRAFGGTGDFDGALRLTVWLQTVMLFLNVVQMVLLVVLPPLAALMGIVNLGLMLWLMTNFVAVLHGFRALFPVFVMIIVTGFAMGFALFFLLMMTGVIVPPEVANNV